MKAILMSVKPRHNKNILNLIKLWEIRKIFPKDYVGWIYIYNTMDNRCGYLTNAYVGNKLEFITSYTHHPKYRGKVIARFWCDKVEEITTRQDMFKEFTFYETSLDTNDLCKQSCLDYNELDNYLYGENGYAIHITKLEIFDKPKEISEFGTLTNKCNGFRGGKKPLSRAPQSWCYIEV